MALTKSNIDLSGEQASLISELRSVRKGKSDCLTVRTQFNFISQTTSLNERKEEVARLKRDEETRTNRLKDVEKDLGGMKYQLQEARKELIIAKQRCSHLQQENDFMNGKLPSLRR